MPLGVLSSMGSAPKSDHLITDDEPFVDRANNHETYKKCLTPFGNSTYYYSSCGNAHAIILEICLAQIFYLLEQES